MSESLIMGAGCGKCGATWLQDIKEPLNHECPPSEIELRLSKIEKKLELLKEHPSQFESIVEIAKSALE